MAFSNPRGYCGIHGVSWMGALGCPECLSEIQGSPQYDAYTDACRAIRNYFLDPNVGTRTMFQVTTEPMQLPAVLLYLDALPTKQEKEAGRKAMKLEIRMHLINYIREKP